MDGNEERNRVAIIAIHGVADQQPGDTSRDIVDLLLIGAPAGVQYVHTASDAFTLRVETQPPGRSRSETDPATPRGGRSFRKALRQSMKSDFHLDSGSSADGGRKVKWTEDTKFTDYLLHKAVRNETPVETYATTRHRLERCSPDARQNVDVYEMYWADLSRLSGAIPRIITELLTLIFRLSQLGRDTLDRHAAAPDAGADWRFLAKLQTAIDWLFSRWLGPLALVLLMTVLVFAPAGHLEWTDRFPTVLRVLTTALPAGVFILLLYLLPPRWPGFLAAACVAGLSATLLALSAPGWCVGVLWLAALSLAYDLILKLCDERFPMVRRTGWSLWALALAVMIVQAEGPEGADWVRGGLAAFELALLLTLLAWLLMGALLAVWLLTMPVVGVGDQAGLASKGTASLGLLVSISVFVLLTMLIAALLKGVAAEFVAAHTYVPWWFSGGGKALVAADDFVRIRVERHVEGFTGIAVLGGVLVLHLVLSFLPSVLAELKLVRPEAGRLGRWLTMGYRRMEPIVSVLSGLGVVFALIVGGYMVLGGWWPEEANSIRCFLAAAGWMDVLPGILYAMAGATLSVSVLGGLLSRFVPGLRAPLDAALDVDNHLREFPRQAIPRARIFSRYLALLEHIASRKYDHILIVSHSQGTVISAELLRYLKLRGEDDRDPLGALWSELRGKLDLLTAGCPLRQLYAARFPVIYGWVLAHDGNWCGPQHAALGVQRWVNVYTTGDYVGRWLWARLPKTDEAPHDCLAEAPGWRSVLAQGGQPILAKGCQVDVCLGGGAHTHYFDSDQSQVAALIDGLTQPAVA